MATSSAAATDGEGSSVSQSAEKPVIVRVKRKPLQPPVDGFWLEISERPLKRRSMLDFEKLSISESSKKTIEESKPKKVFVQRVETITKSEATAEFVQSFLTNSNDALERKPKNEERKHMFKKDNRQDQLLSKAKQNQETLAKSARFEQIWRSRKGAKGGKHDKALHKMCHFYDVVRVDVVERASHVEELSLEDQRMLSNYLPLLQEFIPSAAAELESDIRSYMSQQDEYVYDYYAVNSDMVVDDEGVSHPFPLVQVEDDDFYDVPCESEYDSEDSNAEDNPNNDYPDEISEDIEDESETSEESEENESESEKASEYVLSDADKAENYVLHEDGDFYDSDYDNRVASDSDDNND